MKAVWTLVVLGLVSGGIFALGTLRQASTDKPILNVAEEVALTVNVAQPQRGEITRLVQAPGDVEAVIEVDVSSEIVSKIIEMPVEEGDFVKKGDLLCRLDDSRLRAEVESGEARIGQLKAAIVQAEADAKKAERDFARQSGLFENDASSDREFRDYRTLRIKTSAMLEQRKFELAQAEATLKRLNEELLKAVIRSPISGVIAKLFAKQGEVVVTGTMNNAGTVIMTVSDLSRMQVRTRVDEIDVPWVKKGQIARVYLQADQNRPVAARVLRVASKGTKPVGRDVVTFETLLEVLSDDDRIKPGMSANVEIEVAKETDAITIPVEAVVHRMRKELPDELLADYDKKQEELDLSERARQAQYIKVVYVMKDEKAEVRFVDTGIADTRRVELRHGIEMGDTVIVGPYRSLDQLKTGTKVSLSEETKKKIKTDETETQDERLALENGKSKSTDESEKVDKTASAGRTP